jgi:phage-related protein
MALTFDWAESIGTQVQVEPKVVTVRMGDGYAQRSPDGLNNMPDNWDMRFTAVYPVAGDEIVAFFKAHGGWIAFQWTPPRSTVPGLYICKQWSRTLPDVLGLSDISARFERDYQP